MKNKVIGIILTLIGATGLIYAGISQFTNGMDKQPAAGILIVSIIIVFIGIGQLYKKHPDEY
ncbi:MAG: hypothetical protein H7289_08990 [Mucilaginibacter sp.]|nr:hypothetical protein [Mucilaginibacter sp.]